MWEVEHERIESFLKQRLDVARAAYQICNAGFDAMVQSVPTGLPHPDGVEFIKGTGRNYRFALDAYSTALKQYSDFIMHGAIPDGFPPPE